VTDHTIAPTASGATPQPPTVSPCAICGRLSLWIDPFRAIPRQLRRAAAAQKNTFLDDR
jgi:hypothetical protein